MTRRNWGCLFDLLYYSRFQSENNPGESPVYPQPDSGLSFTSVPLLTWSRKKVLETSAARCAKNKTTTGGKKC